MLRRTLATLARTALLPVRAPARLVQANQHFYLPVLNGALGDQLAARHDPRAIQLSFRAQGRDVPVAELPLGQGPPRPTLVFVHGLMGDELIWQTDTPLEPEATPRYGPRLAADTGAHVLYVRYNTGLHISENGRALSQLLAELLATHAAAIGPLTLVGHSMGGLVIRSAGYYAASADAPAPAWLDKLRAVFLLGVPHEGSHLEQNSAAVEQWLRRLNVLPTRLAGDVLAWRSNGIKDLGRALLVDDDWQQPDPARPRTAVPLLAGVAYHVLVGSWLGRGRAQALRDYLGDGLVSVASGLSLVPEAGALPPGTSLHTARFAAQHHGGLLHDEAVYQYLRRWL